MRAGALESYAQHAPLLQQLVLRQSFVGAEKTSLILVDCHLPIDGVCKKYVRLIIEDQESEASASACTSEAGARELGMLLKSVKELSSRPARI